MAGFVAGAINEPLTGPVSVVPNGTASVEIDISNVIAKADIFVNLSPGDGATKAFEVTLYVIEESNGTVASNKYRPLTTELEPNPFELAFKDVPAGTYRVEVKNLDEAITGTINYIRYRPYTWQ